MRSLMLTLFAIAIALAGVLLFGPREPVDFTAGRYPTVSPDPETFIAAQEAAAGALVPGTEKTIVWANPDTRAKTGIAVVYIHGFSASLQEIRPVPDQVAEALGANLFFTRLTGHGHTDTNALGEAQVADWMRDVGEALEIGRMLGERVILIGTSNGGALSALASFDLLMSKGLAGVVFVSPNFRIADGRSGILTLPFARQIAPALAGDVVSVEPINAAHGLYWTQSYPTVALLPLAATAKAANALPFARALVPALFIYSPEDKVTRADRIAEVAAAWRPPVDVMTVTLGPDDDPFAHVIAGDVFSPGQTAAVTERIVAWAQKL